jgi:hypothetical protein
LSEVAYILTGQPALRLDLSVNLYEVWDTPITKLVRTSLRAGLVN